MKTPLQVANETIEHQTYLLNQQSELLQVAINSNKLLTSNLNELERQNHKLNKELDGYKKGRFWTIICSFLPTTSFK